MARWRLWSGWSEDELKTYLDEIASREPNFDTPFEQMTLENGWTVDGAKDQIAQEPPGPPLPDGPFERARQALIHYDFSDPRLVVSHFDPQVPFEGRSMILEIKPLCLRYLNGVRAHNVRDEHDHDATRFGFCYITLQGHIEKGFETFLLTKEHSTGAIRFESEAHWQLGTFPNWWSHLGFFLVGRYYRKQWRDHAPQRLRRLAQQPATKEVAAPGALAHRGDTEPERTQPLTTNRLK